MYSTGVANKYSHCFATVLKISVSVFSTLGHRRQRLHNRSLERFVTISHSLREQHPVLFIINSTRRAVLMYAQRCATHTPVCLWFTQRYSRLQQPTCPFTSHHPNHNQEVHSPERTCPNQTQIVKLAPQGNSLTRKQRLYASVCKRGQPISRLEREFRY